MIPIFSEKRIIRKGITAGYNYILVEGRKRKIRVCFAYGMWPHISPEVIAIALDVAQKKGWKNIYLRKDDYLGETIEAENIFKYMHMSYNAAPGIYISCIERITF